jgi:hypothetical protein
MLLIESEVELRRPPHRQPETRLPQELSRNLQQR